MYFQSDKHQQRFEEATERYGYPLMNDQKALFYLATADVLKSVQLAKIEHCSIEINQDIDANKFSSSEVKLARLALNLYNSSECDSIATIIDCLDSDNRKLLIQAIMIRANINA